MRSSCRSACRSHCLPGRCSLTTENVISEKVVSCDTVLNTCLCQLPTYNRADPNRERTEPNWERTLWCAYEWLACVEAREKASPWQFRDTKLFKANLGFAPSSLKQQQQQQQQQQMAPPPPMNTTTNIINNNKNNNHRYVLVKQLLQVFFDQTPFTRWRSIRNSSGSDLGQLIILGTTHFSPIRPKQWNSWSHKTVASTTVE